MADSQEKRPRSTTKFRPRSVRQAMSLLTLSRLPTLGAIVRGQWPVYLVAMVTFGSGLTSILHLLLVRFSSSPAIFNIALPFGLHHAGRSLTLASGFALIYLSFQLMQRRWTAWVLAMILSGFSVLVHLGRGSVPHVVVVPVITLVVLLLFRSRFTVRSEFTSISQGLALAALSLVVALGYGTVGFWLQDRRDFGIEFQFQDAFFRTLREFVLVGNTDLAPHTRHARWFLDSLGILGAVAATFAAYGVFRPAVYHFRTLPHERVLAGYILSKHARSSVDFFKLWRDKSYFFDPERRCVIAYKVALSTAISLGDPVGPEEHLEDITREFLRFCNDNGWSVAFHQVLPDLIPMYRSLGFDVLKIGEDAVVDLGRFSNETVKEKKFQGVRRKLQPEGYTVTRNQPPNPPGLVQELKDVSDEWLSLPGRRERSFTLGQFGRSYIAETSVAVLRDMAGRAIAFVNEVPAYRSGQATIDLMRHRMEIPNGAMDYLFAELLQSLKDDGYQTFSLGLVPFAGVGDRPGASWQERAVRQLFEHLNRFFSYKGLRSYKAKFEPVWEERFLVYQGGPLGLARTAIALVRATEG